MLGLPPSWYKSAPYRSRAVIDPRGVLAEFGVSLPGTTRIRVWDSTAEMRYLVIPMRPEGTQGWSQEELADLVTRDSMIGTGLARDPASLANGGECRMNGAQDMGGMHGFGPVQIEAGEIPFHHDWERRAFGITIAMGASGAWNLDMSRHARETLPPADYLASRYFEIWTKGVERLVTRLGLVSEAELAAGAALEAPVPVRRVLRGGDVEAAMKARWADGARSRRIPAAISSRATAVLNPGDEPRRPYPPAPLCTRQTRRHRHGAWRARLSRHPCPRPGRGAAMALQCPLLRGRELWGEGSRSER